MTELEQLSQAINSIFNGGYDTNGTSVSCSSPLQTTIYSDANSTTIDFHNNLPKATVHKYISLSFYIEGIVFKKDSGILKLKYFPDITFSYAKNNSSCYSCPIENMDFSDIVNDIDSEYADEDRKKLAHQCLQYAKEWATITSYGGISFQNCTNSEKTQLKKQCRNFVKESVINDYKKEYGSVILTIILLNVILPIIIRWIVEKLFKKLFG